MHKILGIALLTFALSACSMQTSGSTNSMSTMDPDKMAAMMKASGTPGSEHKDLEPLVGEWNVTAKFWLDPSKKEPVVDTGRSTVKWILGGRYIQEDYKGKWMGEDFKGRGTLGYDRIAQQYFTTWIDNASTGIMRGVGEISADKKVLEMETKMYCPIAGDEIEGRSVTTIISPDEHRYEAFGVAPDGSEVKVMEIVYKRVS